MQNLSFILNRTHPNFANRVILIVYPLFSSPYALDAAQITYLLISGSTYWSRPRDQLVSPDFILNCKTYELRPLPKTTKLSYESSVKEDDTTVNHSLTFLVVSNENNTQAQLTFWFIKN